MKSKCVNALDIALSFIMTGLSVTSTSFTAIATSFPGSFSSAFLGRWKKDPGCSWSRDHQESGVVKFCWAVGMAESFDCCCGKLCGFQNLKQSLKTTRLIIKTQNNFLDCDWFKKILFSTNLLAKLLSDSFLLHSLLSDGSISQSHSKLEFKSIDQIQKL